MPVTPINVGAGPNDGTGDLLRDAFIKVNNNDAFLDTSKASTAALATTNTAVAGKLGRTENAVSATKLLTARRINGVTFDGTADVSLAISILSNTDFDTLLSPGDYWVNTNAIAATCPNIPVPFGGALMVQPSGGGVGVGAIQTYTTYADAGRKIYQRSKAFTAGLWTAWTRSYTEIDPQTQMIGSPSPGNSNSFGRTGVLVAEYRSSIGNTTGAIVFSAGNTNSQVMYLFALLGREHLVAQIIDEKVSGYRTTTWSATNRISASTKSYSIRLAVTANSESAVILGDVNTVWSYPHISLFAAMAGHSGANSAALQGWTANLVTDLSSYTQLTGDIAASPTVGPVSGNAATATLAANATKLATPRALNGVLFDGTAGVIIPPQSVQITSGDLNTYLADGDYFIGSVAEATAIANTPANIAGSLTVRRTGGSSYVQTYQIWSLNDTRRIYQRTGNATGWSTWGRITTTFDPQTDITGNAGSATKLATPRAIGGVLFDGTAPINLPGVNAAGNQSTTGNASTATALATSRNIGGVAFNGTASIDLPGVNIAGTQATSGNAATATLAANATKLSTARAINGTNFDGTGNITTANWGTARAFAIGNSSKSVNGSAAMAWTLAEMGAVNKAGDTMTGDIAVPSLNGGQLAGLRNKIINGKMEIAQRGTNFPVADGYTLDRWYFNCGTGAASAQATVSQGPAFNPKMRNCLQVAVTRADASVASNDFAQIVYTVEGYDSQDFISTAFTLSFSVKSPKTGIHCIAFKSGDGNRSYIAEYTVTAANTEERKTITIPPGIDPTGTWDWVNGAGLSIRWVLMAGSALWATKDAWVTSSALATANQVNCMDAVGNTFAITGVQIEVGSVATPFESLPMQMMLALCQRYYELVPVVVNSSGSFYTNVYYKVPKRSVPTLVPSANISPATLTPRDANYATVEGFISNPLAITIAANSEI